MIITSTQNPLIKKIVKLQQKVSARRAEGLFVVEGRREVSLALTAGMEVVHMLVCEEIYRADDAYPVDLGGHQRCLVRVSQQVYNKVAYRQDAEGILLLSRLPLISLKDVKLTDNPLLLVVERVEKPGNLGAILRTADAAGVDAVILTDPATDLYNPNVIRASLGCVFTMQVVTCLTDEAIAWLKEKQISLYAAALQTDLLYSHTALHGPAAIAFGAEDTGLSQPWRDAAASIIKIPMAGHIDSLNVAASVAILTFEAVRQRRESEK